MQKKDEQRCGMSRRDFLQGVVGGSVATLVLGDSAAGLGQPQRKPKTVQKVRFCRRDVPILREGDVVIVGGSFAAIAAALEFARAGKKVVVVEQRTYLGREMTATLRPWIRLGQLAGEGHLPEPIASCLQAAAVEPIAGEAALQPDCVKRALEDILLNNGVELLYASQPIGIVQEDGGISGIVIGNKSGRQAVVGKVIIDATETATVARVAGVGFEPSDSEMFGFKRTLEFDGVEELGEKTISVPKDIGLAGDKVWFHRGCRGNGHIYVECPMDLLRESAQGERVSLEGLIAKEIEARRRSVRVVSYLSKEVAAFKKAYWAAGSYELHGRHTTRMAGASPKWALKFDSVGVAFTDRKLKNIRLSTSSFGARLRNLWCLQEAARLKDSQMKLFGDPVLASLLGRAFGKSLVAQWGRIEGASASGKSACSSKSASFEVEVKEQDSPQRGRNYQRQLVGPMDVPVITNCDVLVVGGGTSGATASITSAREGMRTVLLELNPGLGGTGTFGGVNSYWFGRHVCFSSRVSTMVEQVQKAVGHRPELWNLEAKSWGHEAERRLALYGDLWNIEAKMHALLSEAKKAGVEVFLNAVTMGTVMEGGKVRGVVAAGKFGPFAVLAKVVIDATGDGDVAAFAGAEYTYGSAREHAVMWYSLAQFTKPGRTRNNFTSMVDVSNIEDYTRAIIVGRRRGSALHDHGIYVASRETRHIKGSVVLTLTDQLRRRQWPDVVNIHYSNCDLKGKTASDWFRTGLIPPHMEIEIPYRALLPEVLENILVAGKAISARHDALPAIRMQADLENLGGVVALAAAQAIQQAVLPREIDLGRLQKRLANMGLLPKDVPGRKIEETRYSDAELKALVKSFDPSRPLHAYSDMEMGQVYRDKIPIVEVCGGNCDRAAAIMEEVLAGADRKLGVRLAQVLALCRSSAGVAVLIEEIEKQLEAGILAPRTSRVRHGGVPPDQGAMPDVAYLLYSLGMTRDKRSCRVWEKVAALLSPAEEDFRDRYKGTFYYVDAVCYGAELLGEAEAVPVLSKIHAYTTLRDLAVRGRFEPDYFHERRAFLELSIGRALARCGSSEGLRILISYLDDNRALLAEFAHKSLAALTGEDYGKDSSVWSVWLAEAGSPLRPCPLSKRSDG